MQIGAEPNFVLFFDCPEEVMVKRVLNRNEVMLILLLLCFRFVLKRKRNITLLFQGRVDDNEHTVKERLKVYKAVTLPVVNHYAKKGKLYKVLFPMVTTCSKMLRISALRGLLFSPFSPSMLKKVLYIC